MRLFPIAFYSDDTFKDIKPVTDNKYRHLIHVWVGNLRSGKFKQGTDELRTIDSDGEIFHCCLGVLNEDVARRRKKSFQFYALCDDILKDSFIKNFGLDQIVTRTDGFKKETLQNVLIQLNDFHGWSFNDIADFIEKYLLAK